MIFFIRVQRKVIFGLFLSTSLYRLIHNFFGHNEHSEPRRTRRNFEKVSRCGRRGRRDLVSHSQHPNDLVAKEDSKVLQLVQLFSACPHLYTINDLNLRNLSNYYNPESMMHSDTLIALARDGDK